MTDLLDEIKQLYYRATASTIERDFDRAIDLIKSMPTEEERERAVVFMEGLAEMKKQWPPAGGGKNRPKKAAPKRSSSR
jgi:hypothetical protein